MAILYDLYRSYSQIGFDDISMGQLAALRNGLLQVMPAEITSTEDGLHYLELVQKFRKILEKQDEFKGENYKKSLRELLSVGGNSMYSDPLRFIFELIQNVDDCIFSGENNPSLDIRFDFQTNTITLKYNEDGFTPLNVFYITGIFEAAKNLNSSSNEIGEKGVGFKSVFGIAEKVAIYSGWFSFCLNRSSYTIPIADYKDNQFHAGTTMVLYVSGKCSDIYYQLNSRYGTPKALFNKNPILFLNKLTSLKISFDDSQYMEFTVPRPIVSDDDKITREDNVNLVMKYQNFDKGIKNSGTNNICCTRYIYPVVYSKSVCQSRYGENSQIGSNGGKRMLLQVVVPKVEDIHTVGRGGLYSFLPTQTVFSVPMVCHAPFKLNASREFVDPQKEIAPDGNEWFWKTTECLSKLLDYVYRDLSRTVKQEILRYLPGRTESLIVEKNDKEKCLSSLKKFEGSHYLQLPLFLTCNGQYRPASEIFCFNPKEKIQDPERIAKLLGITKSRFSAPSNISLEKFGISVERDVYEHLVSYAMQNSSVTSDILDYLDEIKFEYKNVQPVFEKYLILDVSQIECIMKHKRIKDIMLYIAKRNIRSQKSPDFFVKGAEEKSLSDIVRGNFELSEAPIEIKRYMIRCKEKYLGSNIGDTEFFPCDNGIVLSKHNPLLSFEEFCCEINHKSPFSIGIQLKVAYNRLNQLVETDSGSASEYINFLGLMRKVVKDWLGDNNYRNYLNLINKSGSERSRFFKELLQNADDCDYPKECIPTFKIVQRGNKLLTVSNEVGFTRANIRSITAIGDSTKDRIRHSDWQTIGEKGVGFKTVFIVASKVEIYSGEYNFLLSAEEPTIPVLLQAPEIAVTGTKMEITLKEHSNMPDLKTEDILELCLCLRRLKSIVINGYKISIVDTETSRTISIDNRQFVFSKYIHSFVVSDKRALEERGDSTRKVLPNQRIVCYVPEKNIKTEYPLYNGLPTKHRVRIPLVIDAPFELTTSREEIEIDCTYWNNVVRKEMYEALIEILHARKEEERANILRFIGINHLLSGNQDKYENGLTNLPYLNEYNYLYRLRSEKILPTFDKKTFASISEKTAYRYPEPLLLLLKGMPSFDITTLQPQTIIDWKMEGISKDRRSHIDSVLRALICEEEPFSKVFPIICQYAESFIENEAFRESLYEYLQNAPESFKTKIQGMKIIPVYGKNGKTQYVSWIEDGIFVRKNTKISDKSYWILNETLLSKTMCENILGVYINEMNFEWERSRYQSNLKDIIRGSNIAQIYKYLTTEYATGMLRKNDCQGILLQSREMIPLKNELGEIVDSELFLCSSQPKGYFATEMLQSIIVNKECEGLARFIKYSDLSDIHYEKIHYCKQLTADDIEALNDDYFVHSEEILRGFYHDGYISEELLTTYNLEYLDMGKIGPANDFVFPEQSVGNRDQLRGHIQKLFNNPTKIITVREVREVQKGQKAGGETFDLSISDARDGALNIYTPVGQRQLCFCQMCRSVKPYRFIEVNNIELKPKFYFPQLRIALCLECSKKFEFLRSNNRKREAFIDAIKHADVSRAGKVQVPIENEATITFTARHLAEIQEILSKRP